MKRTALVLIAGLFFIACEKDEETKPIEPPVEEKVDCESFSHWYIQIYQTCDKQVASIHLIRNDESKRIDSTYEMGECRKVRTINWQGDSVIGYWNFPMNARAIGGGRSKDCYRYGKNSIF